MKKVTYHHLPFDLIERGNRKLDSSGKLNRELNRLWEIAKIKSKKKTKGEINSIFC